MTHLKILGFTLIELVIVIVLLGILMAVAVPRFLDLSVDAKRAANLQVVSALNASLENYKLQAQTPLNAQSPIQPTTDALSIHYGIMRAIDIKLDNPPSPTYPDGTGSLLFFAFKTKLVGGAVFVPRNSTTKQLLSEANVDPTYDPSSQPQNELGTNGMADHNATTRNLDNRAASVCVRIFNLLLGNGSVTSGTTTKDPKTPHSGVEDAGANPNSPFAYQSFNSKGSTGTPINPATGSFGVWGAGAPVANKGSCLWVRTDSIDSTPVFYIYYDVYKGKFIPVEAES